MRSQLEDQANQIEHILSMHKVPCRVAGGTVTPRWVRFQVLPALGTRISKIRSLDGELAAALGARSCHVSRDGAALAVQVPREDPDAVRLMPLLRELRAEGGGEGVPPKCAALGVAADGAPLLIRLPSPQVGHVLVVGDSGAGKTVLLRTILLSLAVMNPSLSPSSLGQPSGVAVMLIDLEGSAFRGFERLPHLARPVVRSATEAFEALGSLVRLMERRSGDGVALEQAYRYPGPALGPSVVVVIDELADLAAERGADSQAALARLTQRGREVGIHVVAGTREPGAAVAGPLAQASFPVRLVGRVPTVEDARMASGWSGTGAERLLGQGDFIAVAEGRLIRFQAALATLEEVRSAVADMGTGARAWSSRFPKSSARRPFLPRPVKRLVSAFGGGA